MADKEDVPEVQVVPVRSGSVTTLDGTRITSYGAGETTPPAGAVPGTGYPVVMPQPSVIVVTVDRKADDKKTPKKGYSDVFKRP